MIEIQREELAWAGGLFTGEGSVFMLRQSRKTPVFAAAVMMTDLPPLERFQTAVGGIGKIYGPYQRKKRPGDKPVWSWKVHNLEGTQAVMAMLWPWLCPRRQGRFIELLDETLGWEYPEEIAA